MSFVSFVYNEHFLSVVADKRKSRVDAAGKYLYTETDDVEKINKLTKYVFYIITGLVDEANNFIKASNFTEQIISNGLLRTTNEIRGWHKDNARFFHSVGSYHIYFGGANVNNQVKLYSMGNKEPELTDHIHLEGEISYVLAPSSTWEDGSIPESIFRLLYNGCDSTLDSIQKMQISLNEIIAHFDPAVSPQSTYFYLLKP